MMSRSSSLPLSGCRILIAKPGLDGHDIGAKVVAIALRDAGADVIYTGLRKSPDYIARVAIEEDVHAVGLSILSGSHNELVTATIEGLAQLGGGHIKVFVGGTIPTRDHAALRESGVADIFSADMPLQVVVRRIGELLS